MTELTILNCLPGIMHAVIVIQYMMSFLWCTGSGSSNGLVEISQWSRSRKTREVHVPTKGSALTFK